MVREMLKQTPAGLNDVSVDVEPDGRLLLASLYGISFALYAYPLIDLLYTLVPVQLGSVQWRFGAVGFGVQTLWSQALALGLAATVAWFLGHRIVLRIVAVVCVLVVLADVAALLGASLDFVQIRKILTVVVRTKFDAVGARLFLQGLLAIPVFVVLGVGAFRAGKDRTPSRKDGDALGKVYGVGVKQSARGMS